VSIPVEIVQARESGRPVRLVRSDGEILVLRVISYDDEQLLYAVFTSSHPERYGVCDSTGFALDLAEIEGVTLLERPPPMRRAVIE
jgi:hypothetical protein